MLDQARAVAVLARHRYDGLITLYERHGPVFRLGGGRWSYVYLLGPEANRFVFANSDLLSTREAFELLIPIDGETSLIVSEGEEHRRRRQLVRPALQHRQVDGYLQIMADNADMVIDTWRPGDRIDIYQEFRGAIRRSTIQSLFGPRLAAESQFFGDHLELMLAMIDRMPQALRMHQRFGTRSWRRAIAAKRKVDERIFSEIAELRRGPAGKDNRVLADLVHGRGEDGTQLSDTEIRDQAITLIAAGYETTSAAMAWTLWSLLTVKGVWDKAYEEVQSAGPAVTSETLKKLPYLHGVVHEGLRLYPPAAISARKALRDFTFGGHTIAAGAMIIYSPYVTHRLPEVWADPLSFRPERWNGDHKPSSPEFVPFGGGAHRCIGATLATTELTVMLTRLLNRVELRPETRQIRPTGLTAMRPRDGLPVRVTSLHDSRP